MANRKPLVFVSGVQRQLDTAVDLLDCSVTGNAATATNVAWSGVTGKPTTVAGYGITDAVKYGDIIQNDNPFGGNRLYFNTLGNLLYLANSRYTVTASGISPIANVFDGDYESNALVAAGATGVFTINFGGDYNGYPYGDLLLSCYYSDIPQSVSIRVYCNYAPQGIGWKTLTVTTLKNGPTATIFKANNQFYAIQQIEVTVVSPAGTPSRITQFELAGERPGNQLTPVYNKYRNEIAYKDINWLAGSPRVSGNLVLHAGNYTSYSPSLTGTGASGTWGINITGNAGTSRYLLHGDGPRNLTDRNPNWSTRTAIFDFVNSSAVGTGGNFAGVLTFVPWDGTTGSTGDASYQLAFGSTAANGGGNPQLRIRKGIDTTWNSWVDLLTSANYTSYSPSLTGTGASGTWGINITGSSKRVTSDTSAYSDSFQYWNALDNTTLNPANGWWYGLRMGHGDAETYYNATIATSFGEDIIKFRRKVAGVDQPWRTLLHDNNYTDYTVTKTGTGASGTWGISVTGNAATVTNGVYTTGDQTISGKKNFTPTVATGTSTEVGLRIAPNSLAGAAEWRNMLSIRSNYNGGANGHAFYIKANASNQFEMVADWSTQLRLGVIANDGSAANATAAKYLALTTAAITWDGNALLDAGNYTTYTVTKTGTGASGTWGISVTGSAGSVAWSGITSKPTTLSGYGITDAVPSSQYRNFGGILVNPNGSGTCTTADFIAHLTSIGMFNYSHAVAKCQWSYAGNNDITDTGFGQIDLAGCVIETFTNGDGTKHVRLTRPTTGAGNFQTLVYNDQGSSYSPGWRAYMTNENIGSFAPSLTGAGASGTWGISVTGNAATATSATTASSTPLLTSLGQYVWNGSTLPASYNNGVQVSFVQSANGFPNYGTVINAKGYDAGGGGSLQMYVPYSPSYGGTGLKVRFGNYDVDSGNSWTSWKTLLADDNYTDYTVTKTGTGASGTWGINITGNAATVSSITSGQVTTALGYTPQGALTLTTTGTSGAATLVGNTLNIPQYSSSGTVTSVGLSLPSIFSVSGSPVTGAGTLTADLASQAANLVWASPNGTAGAPVFRALVPADIPTLNQNTTGSAGSVPWSGVTSKPTTISGYGITDTVTQAITGYAVGANTALAATDTIVAAFGKVQGQLNAKGAGTVTSVGITMPEPFVVSSSPVTGSGTLAVGYDIYGPRQFLATSTTAPSGMLVRGLAEVDIPTLAQSKITNLTTDLAAKAPLASPTFTGTPAAPTAAVGTNTTQLATTAFVQAEIAADAVLLTGNQTVAGNKTFSGTTALAAGSTIDNAVIGYRDIPLTVQNAAYTFALADAGKGFGKDAATAYTYTIPANASVAFPVGTAITVFNNNATANITIAITTDTLRLGGTTSTGSRTLAPFGVCTLLKVAATTWIASGSGLT